jgi:hypothetical protein
MVLPIQRFSVSAKGIGSLKTSSITTTDLRLTSGKHSQFSLQRLGLFKRARRNLERA